MPGLPATVLLQLNKSVRSDTDQVIFAVHPHRSVQQQLRDTKIVFLERGSERAGLTHIIARHGVDFNVKLAGSGYTVEMLLQHTIEHLKPLNIDAQDRGLSLRYAFDDRIFQNPQLKHDTITVGIGYNGFIVTATPVGLNSVISALRNYVEGYRDLPI